MQYRRARTPGGTYFFTLNLANRKSDLLLRHIDELRQAFRSVKARHPFALLAMVVLPEHLHAVWRLPQEDVDYSLRWSLIKANFSRHLPRTEHIRPSRVAKRERGVWQRRFWEHQIQDQNDLAQHVDYIHYNPVKHGWVEHPADWPHSTLHAYIERGIVSRNWGGTPANRVDGYGER